MGFDEPYPPLLNARAPQARPAERSSPAQPTKVLGMFNEGGRLRPSTGAAAGAGGGGAGGGGKKQQEKLTGAVGAGQGYMSCSAGRLGVREMGHASADCQYQCNAAEQA